jgi:hypothetical protein
MMETMISITILSVGLLSLAGLISKMSQNTDQSRYMSLAAMLTSEKLEDLNRYPALDPAVTIATGTTAGSLTTDTTATVGGDTVAYYDQVMMSSGNGAVMESIRAEDTSGVKYKTISHLPDGTVTPQTVTTPPTASADMMVFNRRWIIEKDTPVAGVRRVTVRVSLVTPTGPPVNFQMSMVRP